MHDHDIVRLVDGLVASALALNASDIHCESLRDGLRVRYRVDGVLLDHVSLSGEVAQQVLARIKVLAHLDVAERRIPQDGKFCMQGQRGEIDLRVATFPSLYGEKIVLRILDRFHTVLDFEQLGFLPSMQQNFCAVIDKPQGFVIVTGPTGSGKTTTLYAALAALKSPEKNIVTLEDPIEYNFDGITQGAVLPDIGFTFAKGIRAVLRQDPDIIMVGEIRDHETAEVAIQAALTGHLVLSTLHTNDAPSAVMRLIDMGVEPFLINAVLTGVLAQRLVRKLCVSCRIEATLSGIEQAFVEHNRLVVTRVYTALGCDSCSNLGYKGRIGLFELLLFSHALRALITRRPSFDAVYAQAIADGMSSLLVDGAVKVNLGLISMHELMRTCA